MMNSPTPKVIAVIPLEQQRLRIQRADGSSLILELKSLIQRRDAYWRLRQERYFQKVSIDPLGGICWPEGEDLDPDGLERYAVID